MGAGSFKIQDINMRNQEYQYAVEDARGDIALKKERAMTLTLTLTLTLVRTA